VGDLHENLLENQAIDQLLQAVFDRVRAADIKIPNAVQVRLGKEGVLTVLVDPKYKDSPYIFRVKRENGQYVFSRCFTASSLEILLCGKTKARLEAGIQDILENRETRMYSMMPEKERAAYVSFIDGIEDTASMDITTQTMTADDRDYDD
jgi:hypothetical protein